MVPVCLVVCSDGFCMFSCGGKSDLQDILADIQTGKGKKAYKTYTKVEVS